MEDPIQVSRDLAAYWENQFFTDMARLRVLPPDTVTRVSEYVPEIVAYVEKIIQNGYAYEESGNVWFDVAKFEGAKGEDGEWTHEYAKLQPGSKGNRKLIDEGEGELKCLDRRKAEKLTCRCSDHISRQATSSRLCALEVETRGRAGLG